MANLVITNGCNLSCPFCFATEYRCHPAHATTLSLSDLRQRMTFVGTDTTRFCGGEPTLHPEFSEMLGLALARPGGRAFVMTNGLWPRTVRDCLLGLSRTARQRITFLFNVLAPSMYTTAQRSILEDSLTAVLPETVTLGITLYQHDTDCTYLLELAERFNIGSLRYSVAAPNITDPTTWLLEPQRDFPLLAQAVTRLLRDARNLGIRVQSDCGYLPPCVFDAEQLEEIGHHEAVTFRCHGPLDIGPDGWAWRCYGLFALTRAHIADYATIDQLQTDMDARTEFLGNHDLFIECNACAHRRDGNCGGGCYAFRVVGSMIRRAYRRGFDITDDKQLSASRAHIDRDTLAFFEHDGRAKWMLKEDDTWTRLHLTAIEEQVLAACNGSQTVAEVAASLTTSRTSGASRTSGESRIPSTSRTSGESRIPSTSRTSRTASTDLTNPVFGAVRKLFALGAIELVL